MAIDAGGHPSSAAVSVLLCWADPTPALAGVKSAHHSRNATAHDVVVVGSACAAWHFEAKPCFALQSSLRHLKKVGLHLSLVGDHEWTRPHDEAQQSRY